MALLGTWLLIVFPVSFAVWSCYMMYWYFFSVPAEEREANLVIDKEDGKRRILKRLNTIIRRQPDYLRNSRNIPKVFIKIRYCYLCTIN